MASTKFDVELHSASESRSTAQSESYLKEVEIEAIAAQINLAANGGHTKCIYQSILSDNAKQELKSKGYHYYYADPHKKSPVIVITWDK